MSSKLFRAVTVRKCDNLNKENFWDIVKEYCPLTMQQFLEWMDRYKKIEFPVPEYNRSMVWDTFFANNTPTEQKIKFHHIPLEMQVGIIFKFFHEELCENFICSMDLFDPQSWVIAICDQFVLSEGYQTKCPNCNECHYMTPGNSRCDKCVAELYDEEK